MKLQRFRVECNCLLPFFKRGGVVVVSNVRYRLLGVQFNCCFDVVILLFFFLRNADHNALTIYEG